MNVIKLSPSAIITLAEAASRADNEGRSLRISVDGDTFKYKVGEGTWSAPLYDQPDPYRDVPSYGACQSHCDIHVFNDDCVGFHSV